MGRKLIDDLCNSCDINCSIPLTHDEKSRLNPAIANVEHQTHESASCRMLLLTPDWRRIIMAGMNARTLHEKELAAWCKQVGGEYCTWGVEWHK